MDLREEILKRKKLGDATLKNYISNINKLYKSITNETEIKNLEFLEQKDKVDAYLNKLNPTSITNYYAVILTLLDPESELYESYRKDKVDNNFKNKKKSLTEVNQNLQSKVIDMEEYDEMLVKIKKANLPQDYLMFSLLKHYPIRNEIGNIKIITLKDFKKIKDKNENYLVMGSKQLFIYRTDYKTHDIYGDIKTTIHDKGIRKLLKDYIKDFKDGRTQLFLNSKGESMTTYEVANRLSYISQKYIGKKLSTSSIFKIVLANFKGNDMKDYDDYKIKMGKIRGTAPENISTYYIYKKVSD